MQEGLVLVSGILECSVLSEKARSTDAQREVRKVICVTKKENKFFLLKNCQTNQKAEMVSNRLTGFCDPGKL